jgi:hypothetical protein
MTGLLLEGIVKRHRFQPEARTARSIALAVRWLNEEALKPAGDTWMYLTCPESDQGSYDLNLLIVPVVAYHARIAGDAEARAIALRAAAMGIRNGVFGADPKHFNQHVRAFPSALADLHATPGR